MKEKILATLAVIACICVLLFAAHTIQKSEKDREATVYNGGICIECDGKLRQVSTWVDRKDGTIFHTFKCDTCGQRYHLHYFGED